MSHAGHTVAVGYDVSNHPSFHSIGDEEDDDGPSVAPDEDLNYTIFDLSVDSIDVTLSFARWWQGKGLVVDAVVKGVRGVLGKYSSAPKIWYLSLTSCLRWSQCDLGSRSSSGSCALPARIASRRLRARVDPDRRSAPHCVPTGGLPTVHGLHLPSRHTHVPETVALL